MSLTGFCISEDRTAAVSTAGKQSNIFREDPRKDFRCSNVRGTPGSPRYED